MLENEKEFNERKRAMIIEQILTTISYLHSEEVVIGNLKAENISIIEKDPNDKMKIEVKLMEFVLKNEYLPASNV